MSQQRTVNNKTGIIVLGLIIVVGAVALYGLVRGHNDASDRTSDANAPAYGNINVQTARDLITANQENGDFVVLDVRTPEEVNAGVVEHENANFTVIDFYNSNFEQQIAQLDKEKTYVIYCRTGNRSGQTYERMKELGFDKLYNISGGIVSWQEAGLPVETPE